MRKDISRVPGWPLTLVMMSLLTMKRCAVKAYEMWPRLSPGVIQWLCYVLRLHNAHSITHVSYNLHRWWLSSVTAKCHTTTLDNQQLCYDNKITKGKYVILYVIQDKWYFISLYGKTFNALQCQNIKVMWIWSVVLDIWRSNENLFGWLKHAILFGKCFLTPNI